MCGIAGIFSKNQVQDEEIVRMTMKLLHRGPDANGKFVSPSNTLAFGHTRLCILDLSSLANQPFSSSNQRFVVVFNGEIYNFQQLRNELMEKYSIRFKTNCDTEVIAEGFCVWGIDLAKKLEGMFAIAVADVSEEVLYLIRDRVGKKPFYYSQNESGFYFASEIKSLLEINSIKLSANIRAKSIASFLHLGFIPEPHTIYSNIKKFPAGHVARVNKNGNISFSSFWSIQDSMTEKKVNHNSANPISTFQALLDHSVSNRLISDVPIGTFLSGGTDSSLVTAVASKHVSMPLKTFSIGFKDNKYDERKFAEGVAQALKTDHTAYELSEKDAIDLVEVYLDHFDEPFADTSAIPTMLVSKLAKKHVTVALTGDGGDELFQGYGSYTWANRLSSPLWKLLKLPMRKSFDILPNNRLQRVSLLLEPVEYGGRRSHIFSQEQYLFSQKELQKKLLTFGDASTLFNYEDPIKRHPFLSEGELQALFDFSYYLKDDLLVKVDRASMYYGLECRCPLLDYHIVEFAFGLPASYKVRNGQTKWILKELLRKHLPNSLVDRKKWGFSIPLERWLKGELRYLIDQYLSESVVMEAGLVHYQYISELKRDFFNGKDYLFNRIWLLIVLHKWWKRNN